MTLDVDLCVPGRIAACFSVPDRSVTAVVGVNGAGKSTLLGALAGTLTASGSARIDDEDLLRLPAHRRGVGMVFQDRRLFPHLTALENAAFGLRARGESRRTARATAAGWLERLGVGDLTGRRATELSGGQAQRVALARALATEPRLLLLDEPFTGLDAGTVAELRDTLGVHLAAYDGIALVVSHDPRDVAALAGRTLRVERGRITRGLTASGAEPRAASR